MKDRERKRLRITAGLLAAWAVFIFLMSAQVGDDSSNTSGMVVRFILDVLWPGFANIDPMQQAQITATLSFAVRKMAHFSEYAIFGALAICFFWQLRETPTSALKALALSAAYAATDEFHQLFVDGRAGQLRDVLIDSTGAAFGILTVLAVTALIARATHKSK